jgi:ATP-binding cassette subfamily F protein uup
MASYLQIENISKSYGPKVLFEHIGFNINEGDKFALIAPNGTGKTSLLRIIAGKDKSDSGGKIMFLKDIKIAFLEQEYDFDPEQSVFAQVMNGSKSFTEHLDYEHQLDYEQRVREILTDFNLGDFGKKMKELSGGEVKRVAITAMLASQADLYIMDEPTNHLDLEAIEYLENFLSRSRCTLLMVTHDRYFLDKVCNTVMEMDHGQVYIYRGDYQNYLTKRQERIENYNSETDKVKNILRRELEWMRSTPQARTGKAQYRINAFYELKDRAEQVYTTKQVDLGDIQGASRLGSKIIDCKDVSFYYGQDCYLSHFTYNFQRFEKVGIIGRNGVGKSTFLNLIAGNIDGDSQGTLTGTIERGESLKIGYYHQEGMVFDEDQTVLQTVNDTHLLSQFLFPHDMLNNKISKLSGGEKRRLYLLTILMKQPNLLIMDEPTNDLDIVTLDILEEYLQEFKGSMIIVSHDRHFLDRLVDHLFIFCGKGVVKDFIGDYSEYSAFIKDYEAKERSKARQEAKAEATINSTAEPQKAPIQPDNGQKRLSFKEKRELDQLNKDLEELNAEKAELETNMNNGTLPYDELTQISKRFAEVSALIDEKETRWLELQI